jgi:two-component system, NtrC family, response regulator AtoC
MCPASATEVSERAPPTGAHVLLVVGDGRVSTYPLLADGAVTLGREPGCEVVLGHAKISRRHAVVHLGPQLEIEDLGSTNGIWLAGLRVRAHARVPLPTGVCVQLGPFVAVVLAASSQPVAGGPTRAAIAIADPTPAGVPEIVTRIAQGEISVLIRGETGSGKEVLARTVHELSARRGQFVAVNCAALREELLESELFGHEKGSFSGAVVAKQGLFEVARGGTVFLDEIGEMPLALQAKLLRALEAREVYRVGGTRPIGLEVRFLAATHRDLGAAVAEGTFRRDFWFRINGITLSIPPLRERRAAIPALAERFLVEAARGAGRPPPRIAPAALAALVRHDWPGNVRELRTVMERAAMLADDEELGVEEILLDRVPATTASARPTDPRPRAADMDVEPPDGRARLARAAATHRGNITSIARELGTSRSQVRRLAKRHGIDLRRYK